MRIVSRVAAAFYRPDRTKIYEITARDMLVILDAPDEIRRDPLFDLMVREGSLQVINSADTQKMVELDPKQGTNAEGRKITVPDPEPENPAEPEAGTDNPAPVKKSTAKTK